MTVRAGQQLGNYRLVHLLGRGGFADVLGRARAPAYPGRYQSAAYPIGTIGGGQFPDRGTDDCAPRPSPHRARV